MYDTIYYLVLNRKIISTSTEYVFVKTAQTELGGVIMKFTPPRVGAELSDTFVSLMEII